MCGGTLEIATCSHVGHVFRKSTPYTFPGGTSKIVNHNNARLAEVWLDQWKYFYYNINPGSTNTSISGKRIDCNIANIILNFLFSFWDSISISHEFFSIGWLVRFYKLHLTIKLKCSWIPATCAYIRYPLILGN